MEKYRVLRELSYAVPIETSRLVLRRLLVEDAADMYDYSRLDEVTKYLLWSPHPNVGYTKRYLKSVCKLYRQGKFYEWAVIEKESGHMVGTCGFVAFDFEQDSAEVGYVLSPRVWGKGYATEALLAVMRFGFSVLHLHRISARYMVGNDASRRVMEKCGMEFEGIHRGEMKVKGEWRDIGVCARVIRNA